MHWTVRSPLDTDELRDKYLAALRTADGGDVADLLSFARS